MKQFLLCFVLTLCLTLGACSTTGGVAVDTQSYVATSCAAATAAMAVIETAVDQDRLDRDQRDKVRQAQNVLRPICKDPSMSLSGVDEVAFSQAVADIAAAHAKARSSQ